MSEQAKPERLSQANQHSQQPPNSRFSMQFKPLQTPGVHAEDLYSLTSPDHSPSADSQGVGFNYRSSNDSPQDSNLKLSDRPIINWLSKVGLGKYQDQFVGNAITIDMLPDLSMQDLKEIIPLVGDRLRFKKYVAQSDIASEYPIASSAGARNSRSGVSNSLGSAISNSSGSSISTPETEGPRMTPDSSRSATPSVTPTSPRRSRNRPEPDPRFNLVTFNTPDRRRLHVEVVPTTQPLQYVRHIAKISSDRPIKVNDGFSVYSTDESVRNAIYQRDIREFWIEGPSEGSGLPSGSRSRTKSSSSTLTARKSTSTVYNEAEMNAPLPPIPTRRASNSANSRIDSQSASRSTSQSESTSNPLYRPSSQVFVNPLERPTFNEVKNRLSDYFPNTDQKQLDEGLRNSRILNARFSTIRGSWRQSFRYSKRMSTASSLGGLRLSMLKDPASLSTLLGESETDYDVLEQLDLEDMTPTQWSRGKLIGNGSFGSVYLAFNAITGEVIAVKQVELNEAIKEKNKMTDSLRREVEFLRELDHKNIVQYRGFKREGNIINIFLEYISGGSLASHIKRNGGLPETEARTYIAQCLDGLSYLHDRGIIHRDIKGANILLDHDQNVKISDFGLSKYEQPGAQRFSMQGTAYWMAPEVARSTKSTTKADIWSLGCLIIEMVSGEHPFSKFTAIQAIFQIGNNTKPDIPSTCSAELKSFLDLCFQVDPEQRASAHDLLLHPFIAEGR